MNVIKEINSGTKYSHKVLIEELQRELNKKIDESKNNNLNIFELKKELKGIIDEMIVIKVNASDLSNFFVNNNLVPRILPLSMNSTNTHVFELRDDINYAITDRTQMLQDRITALESNVMSIEEIRDRL